MPKLIFHKEKIADAEAFMKLCPFGAIERDGDGFAAGASCRMCRLCVKKGPAGAAEIVEDAAAAPKLNKAEWRGICVFAEQTRGVVHPVVFELIGKAKELAKNGGHKVICLLMGENADEAAHELLHYGVDEVRLYDAPELRHFAIEPYTAVFENFIKTVRPCAILVGATPVGRQLAPRVASRFRTGLTADCTVLEMEGEYDLQQIRPAFGGNIMAQIYTPNHRPQMATVRYKVMDAPIRSAEESGSILRCALDGVDLSSRIEVLSVEDKPVVQSIENADVLIVAGRGVKKKDDLVLLQTLADRMGGMLACTRPLMENGWLDQKHQIGLSGRTVRPKLIMTFGVSGAVQFTAGMKNSERIFSVNTDEKAPIFKTAHYGIVGDLYEIVPRLLDEIGGKQ